jgi:hypothetical protein
MNGRLDYGSKDVPILLLSLSCVLWENAQERVLPALRAR